MEGADPQWLRDPEAVIDRAVAAVAPGLPREVTGRITARVAATRARRRTLARHVAECPDALVSGRSDGPRVVDVLAEQLYAAGAELVVRPRCAGCGATARLEGSSPAGRICARCADGPRRAAQRKKKICATCEKLRQVKRADRHGRPQCKACAAAESAGHVEEIRAHVSRLDAGCDTARLDALIRQALHRPRWAKDVAWALDARPQLLTGDAARGPRPLLRLLDELRAAGVRGVVVPGCPRCGQAVALTQIVEGERCCGRCYRHARAQPCARCGTTRPVSARRPDGSPLCCMCNRTDPANLRPCARCGRLREIRQSGPKQGLCLQCCGPQPKTRCSSCGQLRHCRKLRAGRPQCSACQRRAQRQPCSRCGKTAAPYRHSAQGEPLCERCGRARPRCTGCGHIRPVAHRSERGEPYCATCYDHLPAAQAECTSCHTTTRLHHRGLCPGCAARAALQQALTADDGTMCARAGQLHSALAGSDPKSLLRWLANPHTSHMLTALTAGEGPLTHADLDQLPRPRAVLYLRQALVAAGALPERDENLAAFEAWLPHLLAQIPGVEDRKVLRAYATWTHLRALRDRAKKAPLTRNDTSGARQILHQTRAFLTWLDARGRTLATCTQSDIDTWLAAGGRNRLIIRVPVMWAQQRGHAPARLTVPTTTHGELARERQQTTEERWQLAHRFMTDEALPTRDRVAGLLVLLYAQPLTRITHLTTSDVTHAGTGMRLTLAEHPVEVPAPLARLVNELLTDRHGAGHVGHLNESPWLFPGHNPGRPLGTQRLAQLLHPYGIHGRRSRNSALADLAGDLPATLLSRMLGMSIEAATNWSRHAATSRADYAAHRLHSREQLA